MSDVTPNDMRQPVGEWPDGDDIWAPSASVPPAPAPVPVTPPAPQPASVPEAQPVGAWPDDEAAVAADAPEAPMRPYLLNPGEPLLLGGTPLDAAFRFGAMLADSRIPDADTLTSPLCALPLIAPVHPNAGSSDTLLGPRARHVAPEWAWHPLAWLPPNLATRAVTETGEVEDDDAYAVRVAIELTVSGVYNVVTGMWLDVPACMGIDTTTPEGLERITRWQQGVADPILDSLSIEWATKDHQDPGWSLAVAQEIMPMLLGAAIAQGTDAILLDIDDITDSSAEFESRRWGVIQLVGLAKTWTRSIDDPDVTGYWPTAVQALSETDEAGFRSVVAEVRAMIEMIRDEWWPIYASALSEVSSINGNTAT